MFQWTTYSRKDETVPPINRVPIGESQYVQAVTRRRRRSAGLSGPGFYGPPITGKRNFISPQFDPGGCTGGRGSDCAPPASDDPPYPGLRVPPGVQYAGVVTGDKRMGMSNTLPANREIKPSPYIFPPDCVLDSRTGQMICTDYWPSVYDPWNRNPKPITPIAQPNPPPWKRGLPKPHPLPVMTDPVGPPVVSDPPGDMTAPGPASGLGSFLSGIPTTYLLLGAVGLYFFMKKR